MTHSSKNNLKGSKFENYIATLYDALNFHVEPNMNVEGQQVDIVAEKILAGIGKTKMLIDCKFLTTGSVSNQMIYDWGAFVSSIPKKEYLIRGVIVSNRPFGKEAQLAAKAVNVTLLTEKQLESEVFEINEYYHRSIRNYEKSNIYGDYLHLDGIDKNPKNFGRVVSKIGETIMSLSDKEWKKIKFITILADFGSGKTTLLEWLNNQYAKQYLEGCPLKPVYLELKYFFEYQDIDLFLINVFRKLFQKDIPVDLIWKSIDNGEFVFLLDGLDEMSAKLDHQIRIRNLQMLSKLILSESNTIISCRSSYYITEEEFSQSIELFNKANQAPAIQISKQKRADFVEKKNKAAHLYNAIISKYSHDKQLTSESKKGNTKSLVIEISELNIQQIDDYLQKFDSHFLAECNASWLDVKDFCYKIYDIKDLLKKPILISMVKDTILIMGKDFKTNNMVYDPSSLYETYTNASFHRDFDKGETRQFLSTDQRQEYAELISTFMYDNDTLEITVDALKKLIKDNSRILGKVSISNETEIEHILSDVVLCTFIKRTESAGFKFLHKSFMEFFVARKLKQQFLNSNDSFLRENVVTQEVLYFIGCYGSTEQQIMNWLLTETSHLGNFKAKQILKRNLCVALLQVRKHHHNTIMNNAIITNVALSNLLFENSRLYGLTFENARISEVVFKNCQFIKLGIVNADIDHITFQESSPELKLRNVSATKVAFLNCKKSSLAAEHVQLKDLSIIDVEMHISGSLNIEDVKMSNSKLEFEKIDKLPQLRAILTEVIYVVNDAESVSFNETKLDRSSLNIQSKHISFLRGHIKHANIFLDGKIAIEHMDIEDTYLSLNEAISCIENTFANVSFKQDSVSSFLFSNNTFKNCYFKGLTIGASKLSQFLGNIFIKCNGFLFINKIEESGIDYPFKDNGLAHFAGLTLINLDSLKHPLLEDFRTEIQKAIVDGLDLNLLLNKYIRT